MLASPAQTSQDLWLRVKPLVREIESDEGVLIVDDSIVAKPSTDESPLILTKQIFTNEDGSTGILYLVSNDTELSYDRITTLYKKRWNVECYHKSLKQNAALAKSPTKTRTSQTNHFFAPLYAYIKLEQLKISTKLNHFALKHKLYIKSVQQAFLSLQKMMIHDECVR